VPSGSRLQAQFANRNLTGIALFKLLTESFFHNFFHQSCIFFLTRLLPRFWQVGRDLEMMLIQWGEITLYAPLLNVYQKPTFSAEKCARSDPGGEKWLEKTCGRLPV
jgi:hypothetical protein